MLLDHDAENADLGLIDDGLLPLAQPADVGLDLDAMDAEELAAAMDEIARLVLKGPLPHLVEGDALHGELIDLALHLEPR